MGFAGLLHGGSTVVPGLDDPVLRVQSGLRLAVPDRLPEIALDRILAFGHGQLSREVLVIIRQVLIIRPQATGALAGGHRLVVLAQRGVAILE